MNDGPSLRARFAIAIALTIVFYVLAIGLAVALIGLPIYGWVVLEAGNIFLTIVFLAAGFTILRAIVPKRQGPFQAAGLPIDAHSQPELTELVESVARDTEQAPPAETYVTLDANAAVTQIGGVLRGEGKRVMIVGMPLMRILTTGELRAVLAHEFGHYAGGDTRLGQWTYRTRAAIGRTITGLHDEDSWTMRIVQRPFIWYGNAFLRITNAISRREEFAADGWAARVAGGETHAAALRKVHKLAPAYDAYWSQEVTPVLDAGALPPVGDGFSRFLDVPQVQEACNEHLAEQLEEERSDPYSSHPTLPERLAAIGDGGAADGSEFSRPALELVRDPDELERRILDHLASEAGAQPLEPIAWDEVGTRVYRRRYDEALAENPRVIEGVTIASLPDVLASPPGNENDHPLVFGTLGAGLAVALAEQGWELDAPVGEAVTCRRGPGAAVEPFGVVEEMIGGELSADAWRERMAELGIEDAPLGGRANVVVAG